MSMYNQVFIKWLVFAPGQISREGVLRRVTNEVEGGGGGGHVRRDTKSSTVARVSVASTVSATRTWTFQYTCRREMCLKERFEKGLGLAL